ncbi:uncharacterized protein LOC118433012 isoform X2 [Folsomia candida]|nr:uncharacterized protein LOC118433012 isoform X2 [Folsomia candida]
MKKYGDYVTLHEKIFKFPGKFDIWPTFNFKSKEIFVDGVSCTLEVPRDQFLLTDKILFTIKLYDSLRVTVEKVVVSLIQKAELGEDEKEENVIDSIMFKRFFKKQICLRTGRLCGKVKIPSYLRERDPFVKIIYEIEVQTVTMDAKIATGRIPLMLGTHSNCPLPSAPFPTPQLENISENGDDFIPTSSRRRSTPFLSLRSFSLLSLLPPSYSQLGSRRASVSSIATLPPHYDDLQLDN